MQAAGPLLPLGTWKALARSLQHTFWRKQPSVPVPVGARWQGNGYMHNICSLRGLRHLTFYWGCISSRLMDPERGLCQLCGERHVLNMCVRVHAAQVPMCFVDLNTRPHIYAQTYFVYLNIHPHIYAQTYIHDMRAFALASAQASSSWPAAQTAPEPSSKLFQ